MATHETLFPIQHTGLVELGGAGGATLQLGSDGIAPMSIRSDQDFSLTGWVRIESPGTDTVIFSQGAFEVGVSNNRLFCTTPFGGPRISARHVLPDIDIADSPVAGAPPVDEPSGVPAFGSGPTSGWLHLAVVYRADAATLTFFMDGDCDEVAFVDGEMSYPGIAVTPQAGSGDGLPMFLGSSSGGKIALWQWCLFNKALDAVNVEQLVYNAPDVTEAHEVGLLAWYDFATGLDGVNGFNEGLLWGSAIKKVAAPAFAFGYGSTTASPGSPSYLTNPDTLVQSPDDPQVPISDLLAASSVQTWFYLDAAAITAAGLPVTTLVFNAAGVLGIQLQIDPTTQQITLTGLSRISIATATLSWDQLVSRWVNLALVANGADLVIYLQGNVLPSQLLSGTQGSGYYQYPVSWEAYLPNTVLSVSLGSNLFGYLQNAAFWSRALSADEVLDFMSSMPEADGATAGLVGFYDCSLLPPNNLLTGNAMLASGSAQLRDFRVAALRLPYQQQTQRRSQRRASRLQSQLQAALAAQGDGRYGFDASRIDPAQFSAERWEALVKEVLDRLPADWTPEQVEALRQQIHADGAATFLNAAEARGPQQGMFTHERVGDQFVFYHHAAEGVQTVLTVDARELSEQTAWLIDMSATLFFGLLSILKVPVSPKSVATALANTLRRNSKLALAFASVFVGTLSVNMYVAAVKALVDAGAMKTFVNAILDTLSWWSVLFFIIELAIELVEMLIPGLAQAIILAKVLTLIASLALVYSQRPLPQAAAQ